jgi:hypothetical protein
MPGEPPLSGRVAAPVIPVVTPDDEYPDRDAIWNASPTRVELFLSQYHHQTFVAFVAGAVLLIWLI